MDADGGGGRFDGNRNWVRPVPLTPSQLARSALAEGRSGEPGSISVFVETLSNKELDHVAEFCMDADSRGVRIGGGRGWLRERRIEQVKSQRFALRLGSGRFGVAWIVPLAQSNVAAWSSGYMDGGRWVCRVVLDYKG
jgi:hypothetical protein